MKSERSVINRGYPAFELIHEAVAESHVSSPDRSAFNVFFDAINSAQVTVRFSFSSHNTPEEVDFVVEKLKEMI